MNAVAATDAFSLYNVFMGTGSHDGGISRSGTSGNYIYSAEPGRENHPVNYVSWFDAVRFVNWLHNQKPSGMQDSSTTEDGAYTLTGATASGPRNPGALYFLPTTDEWYKAAYYDIPSTTYFKYPAGFEATTTCAAPSVVANTANCDGTVGDVVAVGSYPNSISPNGTYDQSGNVREWVEDFSVGTTNRTSRGGGLPIERGLSRSRQSSSVKWDRPDGAENRREPRTLSPCSRPWIEVRNEHIVSHGA